MKKHGRTSGQSVNPKPWRLKAGIGIFVLSIVLPWWGHPWLPIPKGDLRLECFFLC